MKPIQLIMKAFGPYAHEQIIDFTSLKDQLYLITGPTGAGKTTIFDGISYALYGQSSGENRQIEDARSHFAAEDVLTEVSLDFELANKYYRVHRVPGQMRKAKRGSRMTKQKPQAVLYISDSSISEDKQVITGIKEVNEQIESIIGVNEDQFKQIMMIPQGEFRKLLTEGSSEREKVLGRLFDTSLYRLIQEHLNDMSKENRIAIEKLKTESQGVLKLLILGNNEEHPLNQALAKDDTKLIQIDQVLEGINLLYQEDEKHLKLVDEDLLVWDKTYRVEIKKREQAEQINNLYSRLSLLEKTQAELHEKQEAMNQLENTLELADQGLKVMPQYKEVLNHQRQIESSQQKILEGESKMLVIQADFKSAKEALKQVRDDNFIKGLSDLREKHIKLINISEKLQDYVQQKVKTRDAKSQMDIKSEIVATSSDALETAKENILHIKEQLTGYDQAKEAAANQKLMLVRQQAKEDRLLSLVEQIMKGIDLIGEYKRAYSYEKEAKKELEDLDDQWKRLRIMHHMNQAAILAEGLAEGEPCPVCGSLDHPKKARSQEHMVTNERLEEVEHEVESARRLMLKASEKSQIKHTYVVNVIENVLELVANLKADDLILDCDVNHLKDIDIANWRLCHQSAEKLMQIHQQEIGDIEKRLVKLDTKVRIYEDQQKKLTALENMMSTLELEAKDAIESYQKAKLFYSECKGRLEGLGRDIPMAYLSEGVLDSEIDKISSEITDLEVRQKTAEEAFNNSKEAMDRLDATMQSANESLETLKSELTKIRADFEEAIVNHGFTNEEAFLDAIVENEAYEEMKSRLRAYQKQGIEVNQSIKDIQQTLEGRKVQDLEAIDMGIDELKARRQDLLTKKDRLAHRMASNLEVKGRLEALSKEISLIKLAYEKIGRIASVAGGRNKQNMTFERYVLAQLLEDITKAANLRLEAMSGGRFRLQRAEGTRDARKSGGLDLAVSDNYTGTIRPVTSLSGGEMFKASLSMALGLSDVVQSYTGGVKLDAMFIDEGFGSLDQTSLDQAINCLIDLQKTGRSIGIISHVADLKERINSRIEIEPSPIGSRAKIVSG